MGEESKARRGRIRQVRESTHGLKEETYAFLKTRFHFLIDVSIFKLERGRKCLRKS
jgi:hypothetical protein